MLGHLRFQKRLLAGGRNNRDNQGGGSLQFERESGEQTDSESPKHNPLHPDFCKGPCPPPCPRPSAPSASSRGMGISEPLARGSTSGAASISPSEAEAKWSSSCPMPWHQATGSSRGKVGGRTGRSVYVLQLTSTMTGRRLDL